MKRKMLSFFGPLVLMIGVGMILSSCGDTFIGGDTITNNNDNGQSPTTSPSPGAAPGCPVAGVIDSIRVNPFGYRCTAGPTPNNGSGTLPANCQADVTATPKDAAGNDVPAAVHGQGIRWSVPIGASLIFVDDGVQPFNKSVSVRPGITSGEFQLSAELCGKQGSWNARVTP